MSVSFASLRELDRRLLVALVDKVFIYEDKRVEIVFRYRDEFERAREIAENYAGHQQSAVKLPHILILCENLYPCPVLAAHRVAENYAGCPIPAAG